ncbi:hypothetical protein [Maribacter cobaltidurans]|uniref:hypothetical protein n=1 Tax=Maribacter cobaltidurans TaxID=1178778 RepID=UPI0013153B89|nr:hypothetical protein [Maribacter cobaltidurans]
MAILLYIIVNIGFVVLGYYARNEHIVGFFAGIEYLFSFGNGLGFSGNLSTTMMSSFKGGQLPDLGYWTRFQNGSESVYGVLFSSLGVFSILYIYYFADIIFTLFRKLTSANSYAKILKVLALVLFVQGIYQEEAFSPYAFGLVMFLVGLNFNTINEREGVSI